MNDAQVRQLLLAGFEKISEEAYCAGWMTGLEQGLWDLATGDATGYGRLDLEDHGDLVAALHALAVEHHVWLRWSEEADGPALIPLDTWLELQGRSSIEGSRT